MGLKESFTAKWLGRGLGKGGEEHHKALNRIERAIANNKLKKEHVDILLPKILKYMEESWIPYHYEYQLLSHMVEKDLLKKEHIPILMPKLIEHLSNSGNVWRASYLIVDLIDHNMLEKEHIHQIMEKVVMPHLEFDLNKGEEVTGASIRLLRELFDHNLVDKKYFEDIREKVSRTPYTLFMGHKTIQMGSPSITNEKIKILTHLVKKGAIKTAEEVSEALWTATWELNEKEDIPVRIQLFEELAKRGLLNNKHINEIKKFVEEKGDMHNIMYNMRAIMGENVGEALRKAIESSEHLGKLIKF
ncbi:MAG: hypothetical protein J7K68_05985 [Candidatus Diapherotrites archaeon]|nr:hypothetical protein [Candidatus Diapherotrites archaeon]